MKEFKVAMSTAKEMLWEAKYNFVVTFWWVASMSVSCLSISKLTCSRGRKRGAKRACGSGGCHTRHRINIFPPRLIFPGGVSHPFFGSTNRCYPFFLVYMFQ